MPSSSHTVKYLRRINVFEPNKLRSTVLIGKYSPGFLEKLLYIRSNIDRNKGFKSMIKILSFEDGLLLLYSEFVLFSSEINSNSSLFSILLCSRSKPTNALFCFCNCGTGNGVFGNLAVARDGLIGVNAMDLIAWETNCSAGFPRGMVSCLEPGILLIFKLMLLSCWSSLCSFSSSSSFSSCIVITLVRIIFVLLLTAGDGVEK